MTTPTPRKLRVHTPRARPLPCQRRCGKWEFGKTRTSRLEGSRSRVHVSLSLRGEREVGTQRCVHVFLFAHRCQPLGGACTCELWVCFHLRVVQRFFWVEGGGGGGGSGFLTHSVVVCFQFISEEEEEEECFLGHSRGVCCLRVTD